MDALSLGAVKRLRCAWLAALLVVGSCADGSEGGQARNPSVATSTSTSPRLDPSPRFVVDPTEPASDVKQVAVDTVVAIGTYGRDARGTTVEGRDGPPLAAGVLPPDNPLVGADESTIEVIYPQLGGLTENEASVMVVLRHHTVRRGKVGSELRTVDVRLRREPTTPVVIGFGSFGGEDVGGSALSPEAEAVLNNDRIELPDSARWDIRAGGVDDRVLILLSDLAADHRLHITVLASGHPSNVFATDDVSNHTEGRGVDIWGVDGKRVFELRGSPLLEDLVRRAVIAGATEVGAPIDVDGAGGPSFANTLHQDHLHLAFDD